MKLSAPPVDKKDSLLSKLNIISIELISPEWVGIDIICSKFVKLYIKRFPIESPIAKYLLSGLNLTEVK